MDGLANEKLQKISHIHSVWLANHEDAAGDKYLSDTQSAMEAIGSVLEGFETSIVRQFTEAEA